MSDTKEFGVEELKKYTQREVAKMNSFILENYSQLNLSSTFPGTSISCAEYCVALTRKAPQERRRKKNKLSN
jgi:hypothetical protein